MTEPLGRSPIQDAIMVESLLASMSQAIGKIPKYDNDTEPLQRLQHLLRSVVAERLSDLADLGAVQRGLKILDEARARGVSV